MRGLRSLNADLSCVQGVPRWQFHKSLTSLLSVGRTFLSVRDCEPGRTFLSVRDCEPRRTLTNRNVRPTKTAAQGFMKHSSSNITRNNSKTLRLDKSIR